MVLVDTSVWIDFLAGRKSLETDAVQDLLAQEETLAFTGLILQELLQGCPNEKMAEVIEKHFEPFIELFPQRSTYKLAGKIYRDARKRGIIIRSSVDCLVAACALESDCAVHHRDRDYTFIQKVCGLKIHGGARR